MYEKLGALLIDVGAVAGPLSTTLVQLVSIPMYEKLRVLLIDVVALAGPLSAALTQLVSTLRNSRSKITSLILFSAVALVQL